MGQRYIKMKNEKMKSEKWGGFACHFDTYISDFSELNYDEINPPLSLPGGDFCIF
jgi:hypothetical protein